MRTVGGCTLDWLTSGTEIETDAKRKKEERTAYEQGARRFRVYEQGEERRRCASVRGMVRGCQTHGHT